MSAYVHSRDAALKGPGATPAGVFPPASLTVNGGLELGLMPPSTLTLAYAPDTTEP